MSRFDAGAILGKSEREIVTREVASIDRSRSSATPDGLVATDCYQSSASMA